MAINPIELLLTMKNLIGPHVAEAEVQLAGLKSSVTGASAAMEANTVAASGMSAVITGVVVAGVVAATIAVVGLAVALKTSSDRLYSMGLDASNAELVGQGLSEAQVRAERFYTAISEAKERMEQWGATIADWFSPLLITLAENFNSLTKAISNMRPPQWWQDITGAPSKIMNFMYGDTGQTGPESAIRPGYIFGTGITDYQNLHANDPVSGGRKRSGSDRMPQPDVWDYISAAGSYQRPALDRMQSDAGDPLLKLEKTLRTVKVPADAFSDSVGRIQQMAQRASWEMVSLGRDVITGTTTIGEAFKSLIADILMSIAQKKAADFLTNLALGAATGGVGGVAVGAAAGSAGPVTVNISALSSKDVLRSLTSSSGEMNQSYRQLGIAARLP